MIICVAREWQTYRLVKDLGEDQQENGVQEADHGDCNVERIHLLVHVGTHDTHANQVESLNDDKSDRLCDSGFLSEGNEHALDQEVDQDRDDEEVCGGLELDVEESPLVE